MESKWDTLKPIFDSKTENFFLRYLNEYLANEWYSTDSDSNSVSNIHVHDKCYYVHNSRFVFEI